MARVELQRVRAQAQAPAQRQRVLRAVARAAADALVGQLVLAPLQRRRELVRAQAQFVEEQVAALAGVGEVDRGLGLVAVARIGDGQARLVALAPLRLPVQAQRLQAVQAAVVSGLADVVATVGVVVEEVALQAVRRIELPAQAAAGGGGVAVVAVGVAVLLGVEALAGLARNAQGVVHRAAGAAHPGLGAVGAVRAGAHAHVGGHAGLALLGEDLDHAGHGVGAVDGCGGAAQHFDALDLLQRDRLPGGATRAGL